MPIQPAFRQPRTKAQELVEKNNVHCIIGPLAAFEALAIADYLTEKEMPTLGVAAAEDTTQRHPSPWFVRLTSTSAQCAYPLAEYSVKELKYKKIVTIADDFAYGHEMCAGFQRVFEDNGGKVNAARKDLATAVAFAKALYAELPVAASALACFEEAEAAGLGDADATAISTRWPQRQAGLKS